MRILYVSRAFPDPNGRGVERRSAQHLRALAGLGEVVMVTPEMAYDGAANRDVAALGASRLFVRPDRVAFSLSEEPYLAARTPLARFVTGLRRRHHIDQRALPEDLPRIRAEIGEDFDLVFAFRMSSAIWADSVLTRRTAKAVDFDDVESEALRRQMRARPDSPFWRFINARYVRWLAGAELRLMRSWDRTVVCSEADRQKLLQRAPGASVVVTPNAVDFPPGAEPPPDGAALRLLFVGSLDYAPNADGLSWLLREVWPHLRRRLGEQVTLTAVGYGPPPALQAFDGRDGVHIAGSVDSVEPYYRDSDVVVAPIFSGGGTRIKIIEALAQRRAVVTTTLGCEGLAFVDGEHGLIADTAGAFADAIARLAADPDLRRRLPETGRRHAQASFDMDHVVAEERRWLSGLAQASPT